MPGLRGSLSIVLLVLSALGVWGWWHAKSVSSPRPKAAAPSVVSSGPAAASRISAILRAQHTIAVPSPSGGNIDAFYADVNQEVAEGQLLARVGSAAVDVNRENAARDLAVASARITEMDGRLIALRLEASRSRTEADHAKQEADRLDKALKRQAMLRAEGATPRLTYEKAERDFTSQQSSASALEDLARQAESSVAQVSQEVDNAKRLADDKQKQAEEAEAAMLASEIHAPAAGLIVSRKGEVGKAIAPDERDDLFRIAVDLNLLEAVFPAPPGIHLGQAVLLSFPELQINALPAQVTAIVANQAIVQFTSASPLLRPGMPCGVSIPLK